MDPIVVLGLVLLLLTLLYWYGTRTHGTLERLGIPVIKPWPFIGSVKIFSPSVQMQDDLANAKKFGRVWGFYEGPTPQVFVADEELAKRIFIKDFEHFQDRPVLFDFEYGRDQLDLLPGDKWKALRGSLSPALTSSGKLKAMMPTVRECTEAAFKRMDAQLARGETSVTLSKQLFGPLTLDIMAQYAFGIKVPDVVDSSSSFVKHASAFGVPPEGDGALITFVVTAFPAVGSYLAGQGLIAAFKYFIELIRRSIKQRRAEGVERPDLVQAIMTAIDTKVPTKEFRDLGITEDLLLLQGAEMLMAAYDTTGTALTVAAYFLATHPEAAARAAREAEDVGELTYESLAQMPYIEGCIKESLRLSPLIPRHYRLCTRDWECDGVRIPKGTCVILPIWPYHFNPAVFPDPEKFLPERWLGEEGAKLAKYSWMPFGLGPRACLGNRLGLFELRYVLASLLRRYRLSRAPETRLEYLANGGLFAATKPIVARVEKI